METNKFNKDTTSVSTNNRIFSSAIFQIIQLKYSLSRRSPATHWDVQPQGIVVTDNSIICASFCTEFGLHIFY